MTGIVTELTQQDVETPTFTAGANGKEPPTGLLSRLKELSSIPSDQLQMMLLDQLRNGVNYALDGHTNDPEIISLAEQVEEGLESGRYKYLLPKAAEYTAIAFAGNIAYLLIPFKNTSGLIGDIGDLAALDLGVSAIPISVPGLIRWFGLNIHRISEKTQEQNYEDDIHKKDLRLSQIAQEFIRTSWLTLDGTWLLSGALAFQNEHPELSKFASWYGTQLVLDELLRNPEGPYIYSGISKLINNDYVINAASTIISLRTSIQAFIENNIIGPVTTHDNLHQALTLIDKSPGEFLSIVSMILDTREIDSLTHPFDTQEVRYLKACLTHLAEGAVNKIRYDLLSQPVPADICNPNTTELLFAADAIEGIQPPSQETLGLIKNCELPAPSIEVLCDQLEEGQSSCIFTHGDSKLEAMRLSILTKQYLKRGYIQEEDLTPVVFLDPEGRTHQLDLFIDEHTKNSLNLLMVQKIEERIYPVLSSRLIVGDPTKIPLLTHPDFDGKLSEDFIQGKREAEFSQLAVWSEASRNTATLALLEMIKATNTTTNELGLHRILAGLDLDAERAVLLNGFEMFPIGERSYHLGSEVSPLEMTRDQLRRILTDLDYRDSRGREKPKQPRRRGYDLAKFSHIFGDEVDEYLNLRPDQVIEVKAAYDEMLEEIQSAIAYIS